MKIESEYKYTISILLEGKANKFIKEIPDISYINSSSQLKDSVDFQADKVIISCSRKSDYGNLERLITEDNNTIIELIKKSIIYLGLKSNTIPKINKIELSKCNIKTGKKKNYSFPKNKINPFLITENKKIKLNKINNLEFIFRIKDSASIKIDYEPFYVASSRYLFSKLQDKEDYLEFIQLWSAYNSIYNIFTKQGEKENDEKNMAIMNEFIEKNPDKFKDSIKFCEKIRRKISIFQWKNFFIHSYKRNYKIKKGKNGQKDTVNEYDLTRVYKEKLIIQLYKNNLLPYLESIPINKKNFLILEGFIDANKNEKNNNILLLRFIMNNFIYKFRNNYIHGNEEGLQFSIVKYNEHKQLKILINLMDTFVVDLLNCYEDLFTFKNFKN